MVKLCKHHHIDCWRVGSYTMNIYMLEFPVIFFQKVLETGCNCISEVKKYVLAFSCSSYGVA